MKRKRNGTLSWWSTTYVYVQAMLLCLPILNLLKPVGADPVSPSGGYAQLSTAAYILCTLSGTAVILMNARVLRSFVRSSWFLMALVGLCLLSVTWSPLPNASLSKVTLLITHLVQIGGLVVMIRQHEMNLIQVLQRVFAMVVLLNFLFVIVMPDASFSKSAGLEGRHEGLYSSPNNLSQAVVIGFLLWFPLWSGQGLWVGGSISMLSLTVQLLSDSATGLLSLCLLTILGTLIWIKHRWSGGGLWIKACMVLIATIILLQSEEILNSVGRDKSMTGRTFIWSYVLSEMKIDGREEIGYGYGGFWDPFGQSKFVIQDNIKQTHNGYLDWYLQLGYAGTILGIVFLVLVAKRLLWRMRTNTHVRIILITSAILLNNFTEASFLSPRNPYWSILIILFIHEGPNFISTTRRTVAVEKKDISYIAPALA